MSNSTKNRDSSANKIKWNTAKKSERIAAAGYVYNYEHRRLDKPNHNTYENCKRYLAGEQIVNQQLAVVGNDSMTMTKMPYILGTDMSHSPLRDMNDCSRRLRKIGALARTILDACRYDGVKVPYAYFVTLTNKNSGLGELKEHEAAINKALSKMRAAVRHGRTRKSGLHLAAVDGSNARWLGDYKALELALNEACVIQKASYVDGTGIYHPHVHMLLISDKPLNLRRVGDDLFNFWEKQFPGISRKAFSIKKVYSGGSAGDESEVDRFSEGLIEATKYVTKPSFYAKLSADIDQLTESDYKVLAEIQNAHHGRTFKRSSGVCQQAAGFLNFCEQNKLDSLVYAADSKAADQLTRVPDLMTKRATFDASSRVSDYTNITDLTDAQMLFFNQSMMANIGFDASLLDAVHFGDSPKAQLYKFLLGQLTYIRPDKQGLMQMFGRWSHACSDQLALLHANAAAADEDADDLAAESAADAILATEAKLRDVNRVAAAADALIAADGTAPDMADYRVRIVVLKVLQTMRAMGYDRYNFGSIHYQADSDCGASWVFDKVIALLGRPAVFGIHHDDDFTADAARYWGQLYAQWSALGYSDSFIWADELPAEYDAFCDVVSFVYPHFVKKLGFSVADRRFVSAGSAIEENAAFLVDGYARPADALQEIIDKI